MPTYTQSQDEFKTRSIDTVHLNPSIMEGDHHYSSILGSGAAIPIVRFEPVFLVSPTVSGSAVIPGILTCVPGVVSASPSPTYTYQWQSNGVNISGETNNSLTTDGTMDATNITCIVEAENFLGLVTDVSNGVYVEILEPLRLEEQDYVVITGLNQEGQQNLNDFCGIVVDGLSIDGQLTSFNLYMYAVEFVE